MPLMRRVRTPLHFAMILAIVFCAGAPLLVRAQAADDADAVPRSPDELQTLVAPIALYPDALLAQVLAASTYPDDVTDAARWLDAGNDPAGIDAQSWDSSVKGVARYPAILRYMASNADWMNDLGEAFLNQQGDVMAAVQTLRGEALAAGTLTDTPQQTVINQDGTIEIVPTDPQYLYAPIYDPAVVYAPPTVIVGRPRPVYITYGPRVGVGDWLSFDLDWHDRAIYSGRWGANRPWWNVRGPGYRYATYRPGLYRPGSFKDPRGRPIQAPAGRWTRDTRRPPPRPVHRQPSRPAPARPAPARPVARPGRGDVPPRQPTPTYQPPRSGSSATRDSERGRTSRETARPQPTPTPAPRPARSARPAAPAPAPDARSAARPTARPAPDARPSSPTRGGATSGYQNRESAKSSSDRGAASRGKR
jgi:hypothetical protein